MNCLPGLKYIMDEKTKLYVFAKKEIALLFLFMVLISVISFVLGVKFGKNYSFHESGYRESDKEKVKWLSKQEEMVTDVVEKRAQVGSEEEKKVVDDTYRELKQEFDQLDKKGDNYGKQDKMIEMNSMAKSKKSSSKDLKKYSKTKVEVPVVIENEKMKDLRRKDELAGKYTIQLGSYRSVKDAEKFADGFRVRGYNPIINESDLKGRGVWYRVSLGAFSTIAEAKDYIVSEESLFKGTDYVIGRFD